MPALANPRHEAFAQAFVASLSNNRKGKNTATAAYLAAGYSASRDSARRAASRLMTFVDTVAARVAELQAEQVARLQPKLDLSKERVGRRLDEASRIAEEDRNPSAMAASELGIAKVFGHIRQQVEVSSQSFANAKSIADIGKMLLQQVGHNAPSDADISEAIEAHDQLVASLNAIRDRAQALTLEGDKAMARSSLA